MVHIIQIPRFRAQAVPTTTCDLVLGRGFRHGLIEPIKTPFFPCGGAQDLGFCNVSNSIT